MRGRLLILPLALSAALLIAWREGQLRNHGHTATVGDGGLLTSPTITGTTTLSSATVAGRLSVGGVVYSSKTFVVVAGSTWTAAAGSSITINGALSVGGPLVLPEVAYASTTISSTTAISQVTTLGACFAGSTLTITTAGSLIEIGFSGVAGGAGWATVGYLIDGANPSWSEAGVYGAAQTYAGGNEVSSLSFRRIARITAGTHNICLTSDASTTLYFAGYSGSGATSSLSEWSVRELR